MKDSTQLLAFLGHHKCATTWIHEILGQVCRELRLHYVIAPNPKTFNHNLKKFVEENEVIGNNPH